MSIADYSFLANAHPSYIENVYNDYKTDPNSIDPEWKKFFDGFDYAISNHENAVDSQGVATFNTKEFAVLKLIHGYRNKGHLISNTNPLRARKDRELDNELHHFGLSEADLDTEFISGNEIGIGKATLKTILERLRKIYVRTIGWEYNYVLDREERRSGSREFVWAYCEL